MLILMPEGNFQLPEGEVHESSALVHGQTLILSFFVPEFPLFLAELGNGDETEQSRLL